MKKLSFLFSLVVLNCFSQEPVIEWAGNIGSIHYDTAQGICSDGNGNVYITGGYQANMDIDFGTGTYILNGMSSNDTYLAKYNSSGNVIWGVHFSNDDSSFGVDIDTDPAGNVYSVGEFFKTMDFDPGPNTFNLTATSIGPYPNRNIYISKLDANGNFIWAKQIGGNNTMGVRALKVDSIGNLYITGYFNEPITFSNSITLSPTNPNENNDFDIFIAKLDSSGIFLWAKQIGSGGITQRAESIAVDNNGYVYICGQFHSTTDFDPGNGQYVLTPNTQYSQDIFVLKLDSNGDFIWVKNMGGDAANIANSIAIDNIGDLYITGGFSDTIDFDPGPDDYTVSEPGHHPFLLKLGHNGNFQWVKNMGGNGEGKSVNINSDGTVGVTGNFGTTCDFSGGNGTAIHTSVGDWDIFIAEYSNNGNFNWVKCIGGTEDDIGVGITSDPSGNIYVNGNFFGNASTNTPIDNLSLASNGNQDVFLLKINESLNVDDFSKENIVIYPNPSQSELHLKFPSVFKNGNILIYSANGQIVKKSEIKNIIPIENLAKGNYILKIVKGKQQVVTKFIVK